MKIFLFLSAALAVALAAEEKYTTKYDNIDLDEIIHNDRLFTNYIKCILDKGSCTADGAELKRNIPDALQNECSKCSEKQRTGTEKIINYLIENKKEEWNELKALYDPEGKYQKKYESEANKRNLKL